MDTAIYEGEHAIYLACSAHILDESKELAWAEQYFVANEMHKFILGRYVESDKANSNRQHFTFENLQFGQPTLTHAPLNINHGPMIVGSYLASEVVYPTQNADGADLNPYLEALAVFWKHYFEDEYLKVEEAHKSGQLFYSMECLPKLIACAGTNGCGAEFAYDGRRSTSYCRHLNDPESGVTKDLRQPHFTAGALIVPPVKPGWGKADVTQISRIVQEHATAAESLYEGIASQAPHMDPSFWEEVMSYILIKAEAEKAAVKPAKKKPVHQIVSETITTPQVLPTVHQDPQRLMPHVVDTQVIGDQMVPDELDCGPNGELRMGTC